MNLLKRLLVLVACAGVTGSAQATERPRSAGAFWPAVMTDAQAANVTDPGRGALSGAATMELPSGVDRLIYRAASGLEVAFSRGGGSASAREKTGAGAREGISTAAAAREPPGWMQLLCGLVFVGFMARRRAHPPAD